MRKAWNEAGLYKWEAENFDSISEEEAMRLRSLGILSKDGWFLNQDGTISSKFLLETTLIMMRSKVGLNESN